MKRAAISGSSLRRVGAETPVLPQPGDRVDTFQLEEAIGVGGMGAVFRAIDTQLDREVALKILPPDLARDPESIPRFYQEGRAAARLDHENIARVFSIGHDGSVHYIAFEFIDGTTIRQKIEQDGILSVGEAIEVTLQIAAALVHASARGVVHRDVKPSNIIITTEGRAKLVDMGLARQFEHGADTGLTQPGTTLGTFDYISPEQARDPRDVDVRSDLYSLGCTLFFMLSGRPPFPEGNVVQKLLKHQEMPAPDIRSANASVPTELAAIITKLMVKDRDRRYQTPEQLVRDLLSVSATLGLRPTLTGLPSWPTPKPPPAWERHLIWAVPALAFVVLITALILASSTPSTDPSPAIAAQGDSGPRVKSAARVEPAPPKKEAGSEPVVRPAAPALLHEITVNAGDDLLKVMAEAPPRSTILLADDGPYTLRPSGRGDAARLSGLDLKIKADLGSRPVIRLARGPGGEERTGGSALFDLRGGRLSLERLELVVDPSDHDEPATAIQAEDVDLTITQCLIRRSGISGENGQGRGVGLRIRSSLKTGAETAKSSGSTLLDSCHIDGGLTALVVEGPAEVSVRDTTFGPAQNGPTFDFRNPDGTLAASIHLRHVSVLAGTGPVFSCLGLAPRLRVNESVIAPSGETKATLVESDDPAKLDWRGMDNLYSKIGTYLQAKRVGLGGRSAVSSFESWSDDPASPREFGSTAVTASIWDAKDPARSLVSEANDPARLFRLGEVRPSQARLGARQGPFGPIPGPTRFLAEAPGREPARPDREPPTPGPSPTDVAAAPLSLLNPPFPFPPFDSVVRPLPKGEAGARPSNERPPVPNPAEVNEEPGEEMPEMPVMQPTGTPSTPPTKPDQRPADQANADGKVATNPPQTKTDLRSAEPKTAADPSATTKQGVRVSEPAKASTTAAAPTTTPGNSGTTANGNTNAAQPVAAVDTGLIRTAAQFAEVLRKASNKGETLRLAADADWDLPAAALSGTGSWTIRAEPGATRPKLRFRPSTTDLAAIKQGSHPAWLTVLNGSLRLEGVDLIVPADAAPKSDGCTAILVGAGGDVSLTDCTLTVEGDRSGGATLRVVAGEPAEKQPEGEAPAATIRLKNSLLRSGGDLINVESGQPVDIEIDNAVVATSGSLLHGHGGPKNSEPKTLKLTLRQVSARVAGGIVQLDSTAETPELPFAEIVARNSVIATTLQGDPIVRLDGQDDADALRGRVHWDGHNVAYHRISTYRRDRIRKVGTAPTLFDRASWEIAVGRREATPIHDDLKFTRDWADDRSPWTLSPEDVQLRADSPASLSGSGSDLSHIPEPPAAS